MYSTLAAREPISTLWSTYSAQGIHTTGIERYCCFSLLIPKLSASIRWQDVSPRASTRAMRVMSFLTTALTASVLPIGSVYSFQANPLLCDNSSFLPPACHQISYTYSQLFATARSAENLIGSETIGDASSKERQSCSRRALLAGVCSSTAVFAATTTATPAWAVPEQMNYSSNARNMARLSSGDKSGGSVYDNDPQSPAAAKRRAMLGCKINSSRNLAANDAKIGKGFSEKDCNQKVMGGDSEFMLKALRKLDCPTCPYGIEGA